MVLLNESTHMYSVYFSACPGFFMLHDCTFNFYVFFFVKSAKLSS